ncbi:MAG: hypothetical protein IPK52_00095 [Chloroflexi bacterium]|nr:hypothetical protein [Chloroflexota bacterium]
MNSYLNNPYIQIPDVPKDLDPAMHEDFVRACQYILWREASWPPLSVEEIAARFGMSRVWLWHLRQKWDRMGLLKAIRSKYFLPIQLDEIQVAHAEVMRQWPQVLEHLVDIAVNGRGRSAVEAADRLHLWVVQPAQEMQEDAGYEEAAYLRGVLGRDGGINPLSIAGPSSRAVASKPVVPVGQGLVDEQVEDDALIVDEAGEELPLNVEVDTLDVDSGG